MKKFLCITFLALLCLLPMYGRAEAACQSDDGSYGAVTLQAPTLPTTGSYVIWTRLQTPDLSQNGFRLQVNEGSCYEVGGSNVQPNQWQWVSSQDGNTSRKINYNFEHTEGNSLKLIGTASGVKIDRVLLIKTDCVPVDLGANCASDSSSTTLSVIGASEVPPPTSGNVGGLIVPSLTISQNMAVVSKVVYFSDSALIPTAKGFALDTTLLSNGTHRIATQITKIDGTITNEVTTLNVANNQNALSPISRWARLNQRAAVTTSIIVGVSLLVGSGLLIMRHVSLKKRLLEFRGF